MVLSFAEEKKKIEQGEVTLCNENLEPTTSVPAYYFNTQVVDVVTLGCG